MSDNMFASVSGVVIRQNKVLLVRQAYGSAKGLLIIPGGYLTEGEMPDAALKREILEETGIVVSVKNLLALRFSKEDWWAIFCAKYVSGEPVCDESETSEALFIEIDDVLSRQDLTYTTKEILEKYKTKNGLELSDFCPAGIEPASYQLYL